jgi:uncharacterized protein YbaA (DUF1428 family)
MSYVDGFLLPIPTKNLPAYRKIARLAAKVWLDHGALDYHECVGDDLQIPGMVSFVGAAAAKKGESVVFAYIVYKSRAHRDRVNKLVMADPRLAKFAQQKMPFDCKRIVCGGFKTLVAPPRRRK